MNIYNFLFLFIEPVIASDAWFWAKSDSNSDSSFYEKSDSDSSEISLIPLRFQSKFFDSDTSNIDNRDGISLNPIQIPLHIENLDSDSNSSTNVMIPIPESESSLLCQEYKIGSVWMHVGNLRFLFHSLDLSFILYL